MLSAPSLPFGDHLLALGGWSSIVHPSVPLSIVAIPSHPIPPVFVDFACLDVLSSKSFSCLLRACHSFIGGRPVHLGIQVSSHQPLAPKDFLVINRCAGIYPFPSLRTLNSAEKGHIVTWGNYDAQAAAQDQPRAAKAEPPARVRKGPTAAWGVLLGGGLGRGCVSFTR